jgi:hypothetical protein
MKKVKPSIHEKELSRVKKQANRHLDKFRNMELDLQEAVFDLHGVVVSIDEEMDKLAALRIKVQKQISGHEEVLKNIGNFTGGVTNE